MTPFLTRFFQRFVGALVLDAGAFEDIEADRRAGIQSGLVVLAACGSGGVAALGLGIAGVSGFLAGMIIVLGGWLIWVAVVASVGTIMLAEPQTKSDLPELLRTLGFAAAPAVFLAFAAMPEAAPFIVGLVMVWMTAAAVVGVRQALDYRGTGRAIAVCILGWLISFAVLATLAGVFSKNVS